MLFRLLISLFFTSSDLCFNGTELVFNHFKLHLVKHVLDSQVSAKRRFRETIVEILSKDCMPKPLGSGLRLTEKEKKKLPFKFSLFLFPPLSL